MARVELSRFKRRCEDTGCRREPRAAPLAKRRVKDGHGRHIVTGQRELSVSKANGVMSSELMRAIKVRNAG